MEMGESPNYNQCFHLSDGVVFLARTQCLAGVCHRVDLLVVLLLCKNGSNSQHGCIRFEDELT